MPDFKLTRLAVLSAVIVLLVIFMWQQYANTPYFVAAFSAGVIFLLLSKEAWLFYLYSILFWLPASFAYGPLNEILREAWIAEVGAYAAFIGWLAKGMVSLKFRELIRDIFGSPFLAPLALFFIGGSIAYHTIDPADNDIAYVLYRQNCFYGLIIYFLSTKLIRTPGQAKNCLLALLIGACALGGRYFYFFQFKSQFLYYNEGAMRLGGYMPVGKSIFAITSLGLAVYFAILLPVAAIIFLADTNRLRKYLGLLTAIALFFLLLITGTRSCWIGAIVGIVIGISLYIKYTKARLTFLKALVFLILLILGILFIISLTHYIDALLYRTETLQNVSGDMSLMARVEMWKHGIGLLFSNPQGLGFRVYYRLGQYLQTPHNMYISIGFTNGMLGLIGFIWFIAAWLKRAFSYLKSGSAADKMIYIAGIAGIAAFLFSASFDSYNHFFIDITVMWLVFGIVSSMMQPPREQEI